MAPHHESSHLAATVMKRLAALVIAALVACSNSPTALDLSALDLSGRWTLLDSATAVQVDTDRVYATVVARGTVVLATLGRSEERRVGKEGRSRWSPYH